MGPPGIQGTLRLGLRLLNTGPMKDRFLLTLPSAHGAGSRRTPGPGSLAAVTGLGGRESLGVAQGFARPPEALAGFGTHWEQR